MGVGLCSGSAPAFEGALTLPSTPDDQLAQGKTQAGTAEALAVAALERHAPKELACWARNGNQAAQFTLGFAYEFGRSGVSLNIGMAQRYYAKAAKDRPTQTFVYSPPVGNEGAGRVIPVNLPPQPGLPAAREGLRRIRVSHPT